MQSLGGHLRSRTGKWCTLLIGLLIVLAYLNFPITTPNHHPLDAKEVQDFEAMIKKAFVPRIVSVGAMDRPTLGERSTTLRTFPIGYTGTTRPPVIITTGPSTTLRTPGPHSMLIHGSISKPTLHTETSEGGIPRIHVKNINCAKLVDGDPAEVSKAHTLQVHYMKHPIPDMDFTKLAADCKVFKEERSYITKPLSKEEEDFSIAYSMMMFKDVEQAERLLRAIYRPQNYYCIHVDRKSNMDVHRAMHAIARCFDNVIIASKTIDVEWGWFSVLEPDLVCMEDLFKYKKWRYFINLTGQEFPLKTNLDLVRILRVYNGTNDMEGTVARRNPERTDYIHQGFYMTSQRKDRVPHGIHLTKGSVHITASRAFVDYVLHNQVALDFKEWVKNTGVPDETFFSSLNHSPHLGIPGAYKGDPETNPDTKPFLTRFKNWGTWPFDYPCAGKRVRMVCVFAVGDLKVLSQRPELFANKFYLQYEPLALDCMEELHYNRTREEYVNHLSFETSNYKQLSFVKNHV